VSTPTTALIRSVILSAATLLSSAGTLVCCVLPVVLVALGAGAALAGLVTAIPQLVWLSAHKALVFWSAFVLLLASGAATLYARALPCPMEPGAARACRRLRRINVALYSLAVVSFALGLAFAFVLPRLR
jgi:hypothetical protein